MTAQATQQLLQQNDVFFVDTLPGHRALNKLKEVMGVWMSDTVSHDSHLLVIRKRALPRTRGIAMQHAEKRAIAAAGHPPVARLGSRSIEFHGHARVMSRAGAASTWRDQNSDGPLGQVESHLWIQVVPPGQRVLVGVAFAPRTARGLGGLGEDLL